MSTYHGQYKAPNHKLVESVVASVCATVSVEFGCMTVDLAQRDTLVVSSVAVSLSFRTN